MGLISRVSSRTYRKEKNSKKIQQWPTLRENDAVRVTCSVRHSVTRVCQVLRLICTCTSAVISLILKVMVPSKRVCPIKPTTVRPDVFSTLLNLPSVSLSTSVYVEKSSPNASTSASSTSNTLNLVCRSSNVSTITKLNVKPTRKPTPSPR